MRSPVARGEACGALAHRPSLGGTPTDRCPCPRTWWGPEEDDPFLKPPTLTEPTAESLAHAAVRQSWWDQHQRRVDDLEKTMDRVMEPFALHGPGLEPLLANPVHEPNELGWAAPSVRFVCPRGHLVDDVRAHKAWDGDSEDMLPRWYLRSSLKWKEGRGLHAAAPWDEVDRQLGVNLRNRARCRNAKCRYDGEKKLEDLLKLYAAAVTTGLRQIQLRD